MLRFVAAAGGSVGQGGGMARARGRCSIPGSCPTDQVLLLCVSPAALRFRGGCLLLSNTAGFQKKPFNPD